MGNTNTASYYNFNNAYFKEQFAAITQTDEFKKIIKSVMDTTIPHDDLTSTWWDNFCTIPEKDTIMEHLKTSKSIDDSYKILKNYSFPQLSPIEDPEKYNTVKYADKQHIEEARDHENIGLFDFLYESVHNSVLITEKKMHTKITEEKEEQNKLIKLAEKDTQIEWYYMIGNKTIMNGAIIYYIFQKMYPNIKWQLVETDNFEFITNIQLSNIKTTIQNTNDVKFTTNTETDIIVCPMFSYYKFPINQLIQNNFKIYTSYEEITDMLVKEYKYKKYN